jgi:hypothetical protein
MSVAAAMSWGKLDDARRAAIAAAADLDDSARCAQKIQECRGRPVMAADHQKLDAEMASTIEKCAGAAGVDKKQIVRITHDPAQRYMDTAYKEKPTQVILRDVSLKQLVIFLHGILSGELGLQAKTMRLSAPSVDDAGAAWEAELTLTYMIYDPQHPEK